METGADETGAPRRREDEPVRILVETKTHLVPGQWFADKMDNILNLICQYHWNRDLDRKSERWNAHDNYFGYRDRTCYFVVDHFHGDPAGQQPTILWYKWTGESFIAMEKDLPAHMRSRLDQYPFERPPVRRRAPGEKPSVTKLDPARRRSMIRSGLELGMRIFDEDIEFLKTHPDDARWLKEKLDEQFWKRIEPYCNLSQ